MSRPTVMGDLLHAEKTAEEEVRQLGIAHAEAIRELRRLTGAYQRAHARLSETRDRLAAEQRTKP